MKMAITWTIIVLGAFLHGMKSNPTTSIPSSTGSQVLTTSKSLSSTGSQVLNLPTSLGTTGSPDSTSPTSLGTTASPVLTTPTSLGTTGSPDSTSHTSLGTTGSPDSTSPTSLGTTGSSVLTTPTSQSSTGLPDSTKSASVGSTASLVSTASLGFSQPTSPDPTKQSLKSATKDSTPQPIASDSLTEHSTTTIQPSTSLTVSNHSPQNSPTTVISSGNNDTPNSSILETTTHNKNGKTTPNQRHSSAVTTNPAPSSKSTGSQSIQTPKAQTTSAPNTSSPPGPGPGPRGLDNDTETIPYRVFDLSSSSEGHIVFETCKTLGQKLKGNCSVSLKFRGNQLVATVTIDANQKIPTENYKPLDQKDVSEETIPDTLIAILASCGALVLLFCCFAAYCTCHRRSYRKNQQHLTEEMQTVENGYHDNPTLEVMEVVPEMQEKKLALNGEFNDSWIVPIDNLLKEDIPDEEDTHL